MGRNQYLTGRVYGLYVCFYDGNTRRLNRKKFYGEARNLTCDPGLLNHGSFSTKSYWYVHFEWFKHLMSCWEFGYMSFNSIIQKKKCGIQSSLCDFSKHSMYFNFFFHKPLLHWLKNLIGYASPFGLRGYKMRSKRQHMSSLNCWAFHRFR